MPATGGGACPAGSFFRHGAKETKAPPLGAGPESSQGGNAQSFYQRYLERILSLSLPITIVIRFLALLAFTASNPCP